MSAPSQSPFSLGPGPRAGSRRARAGSAQFPGPRPSLGESRPCAGGPGPGRACPGRQAADGPRPALGKPAHGSSRGGASTRRKAAPRAGGRSPRGAAGPGAGSSRGEGLWAGGRGAFRPGRVSPATSPPGAGVTGSGLGLGARWGRSPAGLVEGRPHPPRLRLPARPIPGAGRARAVNPFPAAARPAAGSPRTGRPGAGAAPRPRRARPCPTAAPGDAGTRHAAAALPAPVLTPRPPEVRTAEMGTWANVP